MAKADIFLMVGRAIITIYLIIIFIMVIAETVERNDAGSEPENYKDTIQVMQYITKNFQSTPIANFKINDANSTATSQSTLYNFAIDSDWCYCYDKNTNFSSSIPYLGECSSESSTEEVCTTEEAFTVAIPYWRGSSLTIDYSDGATYPSSSSNTCSSVFSTYDSAAGMCRKNTTTLVTQIKVVKESTASLSDSWAIAGSFAVSNLTNTSTDTTENNYDVYFSTSEEGSPYLSIGVSLNGLPCLDPSRTPLPSDGNLSYPLLYSGNETGCGYWNTSEVLYETIGTDDEWEFFLNYDLATNTSTFRNLFGFDNATTNDTAYLYAERKLIVSATDFCYSYVESSDTQSSISDIPNLVAVREALCILGLVVTIIGFIVFIVYIIVTRCLKKISRENVGIYVFWLLHGLGILYAVTALIVGSLTNDLTATIEDSNAYLTEVADAACITNVPALNDVYSYLASGIEDMYSYVDSYNTAGIVIAIIFLVLEIILLLWWLIGFSCHENLDEDDEEEKRMRTGARS